MTSVKQATTIWLILMVATAIAALLGSMDLSGAGQTGLWITLASIVILVIKGQLIVDYFMDLKHVQPIWRLLLSAYCLVIGGFVFLAYCLSLA